MPHLFPDAGEDGFHEIFHVDEGDVLPGEARHEVDVVADGFRHQEIVLLPRSVDPRGAEDDVGEVFQRLQVGLRAHLAPAIVGVGAGRVGVADGGIVFFADRPEDAQRADVDKTPGHHAEGGELFHEVAGGEVVAGLEAGPVAAFGHARAVDDVVPSAVLGAVLFQLPAQAVGVRQVEFGPPCPRVLQITAAAGGTYAGPDLHAAFQSSLYQEAPYEAAGAGD